MEKQIIPVILAGGSGRRLWPVSRDSYPKQFCRLFSKLSLLQKTAMRATVLSNGSDLIIVTNDHHYFLCKDQLENIGISNIHYILEPCSRNTAPAVTLAAAYSHEHINPDATLLILPADHYLEDHATLKDTVEKAVNFSDQNKLVVFGICPTSPKTGYGYIEKGDTLGKGGFNVKRFIEKPSKQTAKEYVAQGNFYWNSGMFLFKARSGLNELESLANDVFLKSIAAFKATKPHNEFFRVSKEFYSCRNAAFEYEVMEKTTKAVMLPLDVKWNDLGCWSSVAESEKPDKNGNVCCGNIMATDSKDCLINSEEKRVVAIGVTNQIIISTSDAVLVADKSRSQDVKMAVEQMKLQNDPVATEHKRIYRPWGFCETLASAPGYRVKHIMVVPGAALSLQLHQHRSEHWIVVSGEAEITNNKDVFCISAGQSTYIEKKNKHRLRNKGNQPLSVIEVQNGGYLEEDDIVRFEDAYGRADEKVDV